MADVTKRVNYFDRQFLRAADFQDETAYQMDRRRRHTRLLHSPGIAEGLAVAGNVGDAFVTVAPGTAYDDLGQEIVLPPRQQPWQVPVSIGKSPVYVTIAYSEQPSDPSMDPGVVGNTRITENPALAVSGTPPLDPDPNHALLLATISLDNNQKISTVNTNPPGRHRAGGLPPKSVGTTELADGAVGTIKIADGAITQAKITAGSVSMRELKAAVVVQGTVTIAANSFQVVPGFILPILQPAGFYIPNITITTQPTQAAPALTISWQDEYMAFTANNQVLTGRIWRITNASTIDVIVAYTIHKLEES